MHAYKCVYLLTFVQQIDEFYLLLKLVPSRDTSSSQDEINLEEAQHVAKDREQWRGLNVDLAHVSQGIKRIK